MSDRPPPITSVTGGVGDLAAVFERCLQLADDYDAAGDRLRDWAGTGPRTLADPDLVASAIVSPVTFAEADAAIAWATIGPVGLLAHSPGWETDADAIRLAVGGLRAADEAAHAGFEALDYGVGRSVGFALGAGTTLMGPQGVLAAGLGVAAWQQTPAATRADAAAAVSEWLGDHPSVMEHAVNGSGGVIDGYWDGLTPSTLGLGPLGVPLFHPSPQATAGELSLLYPTDGHPVVSRWDQPRRTGAAPGTLAQAFDRLDRINAVSDHDHPEGNGTIMIDTFIGPDGRPRHIVYLPGTDDMETTPQTMDGDVRDMTTNFKAMHGNRTAYASGIVTAMHEAGIDPGDQVMMVGHSQGGIMAAWIAGHDSTYRVTNVVTAGSPIAHLSQVPASTQMLSLENRGDVIPLTDGEPNRDRPNHVTVCFDDSETSLSGNHGLDHYRRGATAVDASTDSSIRGYLDHLHGNGFLMSDNRQVTSQVFQISRGP